MSTRTKADQTQYSQSCGSSPMALAANPTGAEHARTGLKRAPAGTQHQRLAAPAAASPMPHLRPAPAAATARYQPPRSCWRQLPTLPAKPAAAAGRDAQRAGIAVSAVHRHLDHCRGMTTQAHGCLYVPNAAKSVASQHTALQQPTGEHFQTWGYALHA